MIATVMALSPPQAELNQELRDYAASIRLREMVPSKRDLSSALASNFPELARSHLSSRDVLEHLGIAYIIKISRNQIASHFSCSVTNSKEDAEKQLKYYQQKEFSILRQDLGISSHWIFLVNHGHLRLCSNDEFIDWIGAYRDYGNPECWIIDEIS